MHLRAGEHLLTYGTLTLYNLGMDRRGDQVGCLVVLPARARPGGGGGSSRAVVAYDAVDYRHCAGGAARMKCGAVVLGTVQGVSCSVKVRGGGGHWGWPFLTEDRSGREGGGGQQPCSCYETFKRRWHRDVSLTR
jgi:hypothetical protein